MLSRIFSTNINSHFENPAWLEKTKADVLKKFCLTSDF